MLSRSLARYPVSGFRRSVCHGHAVCPEITERKIVTVARPTTLIEINHKAFRRPRPACRPSIIHHASVKTDASGTKVSFARAPSNPQTGRSHHLLVSSDHVSARRKHASPESIFAANCRLGMAKL